MYVVLKTQRAAPPPDHSILCWGSTKANQSDECVGKSPINSISIFPIMMVGMMFFRPFQALISIQATFGTIEGSAYLQKAVYIEK
jgi:hypothetical protein